MSLWTSTKRNTYFRTKWKPKAFALPSDTDKDAIKTVELVKFD